MFKVLQEGEIFELPYKIISNNNNSCAYIGVPNSSKLSNLDYNDLNLVIKFNREFTFGEAGNGILFSSDYFWYGWSYTHYECEEIFSNYDWKWTIEKIYEDVVDVAQQIDNLMEFLHIISFKK